MSVSSQESVRSYVDVLGVSIFPISTIFLKDFGIVPIIRTIIGACCLKNSTLFCTLIVHYFSCDKWKGTYDICERIKIQFYEKYYIYLSALMTYKSGIIISLQSKILIFLFFNQKKNIQANKQTNKQTNKNKTTKKPVD